MLSSQALGDFLGGKKQEMLLISKKGCVGNIDVPEHAEVWFNYPPLGSILTIPSIVSPSYLHTGLLADIYS